MKALLLTLLGICTAMWSVGQSPENEGGSIDIPSAFSENLIAANGMQSLFNMTKTGLSFCSASVVLGQRGSIGGVPQPADFTIQGIPSGAVIEQAYVWSTMSGSGVSVGIQITDPLANTTGFVMDTIGSGPDKCWSYPGTFNYRADVTSAITGNGIYQINGFPVSATIGAEDTDGATLMVIYSDPAQSWTGTLVIFDGIYLMQGGNASQDITGFSVASNTNAKAFTIIGDMQYSYDISVISQNLSFPAGVYWNMDVVPLSLNSGTNTAQVTVQSSSDCYDWIATGLYYSPQVSGTGHADENAAFDLLRRDQNHWQLQWQHMEGVKSWSLFDGSGRLCQTGSLSAPAGSFLLDLNRQKPGLYLLRVICGEQSYASKLVVF